MEGLLFLYPFVITSETKQIQMKQILLYLSIFLISTTSFCQELTGVELLENAITYHDPNGNWNTFNGTVHVTMESPGKPNRDTEIQINLPEEYFYSKAVKDSISTEFILEKEDCKILYNGSETFSEEIAKEKRLSCERAIMYKNYYTYLYGLPMKLKDPGTIVDNKVERKSFMGKEYLVIKVTYKEPVGGDTWYFYFNPESYAMEIYQFFHEESKNDGEYILLTKEEIIKGIKVPKNRVWYTNKEDQLLGTDILK